MLDCLLSDDFHFSIFPMSSPLYVYQLLSRSSEVQKISDAIAKNKITEGDISEFVKKLLGQFQKGVLFIHDITLAAIVVAMESWQTVFADDFIAELADLKGAEIPFSPRIARLVLEK